MIIHRIACDACKKTCERGRPCFEVHHKEGGIEIRIIHDVSEVELMTHYCSMGCLLPAIERWLTSKTGNGANVRG